MTAPFVDTNREAEERLEPAVRVMSAGDVPALAVLHQQVFAGYAGAAAGVRYIRAFFNWYLVHPEAINLCVGPAGHPSGYVFGAPFGFSKQLNMDLFGELCLATLTHPGLLIRPGIGMQIRNRSRALVLGRENRRAEEEFGSDTFSLVGIGTDPERRGQGIAARLLSRFTEIAFSKGFQRLILDVYKRNEAARQLYATRGWEPVIDHGEILTLVLRRKA